MFKGRSGLTSEQRRLLCDVLSCFLCPLKCDDIGCPFGHFGEGLRKLPSYMCVNYLLSRCKNNPIADPLQCSDGFHPAAEDLIDLDIFNEKVALKLLISRFPSAQSLQGAQSSSSFISSKRARSASMSNKSPTNKTPQKAVNASTSNAANLEEDDANECAICWENPLSKGQHFGLLEMCSHVFCASCLTGWITTGPKKACPMCREYSSRAIIWPECRIDSEEKRQIFDYNLSCVRVYQQNHSTEAQGAANAQAPNALHGHQNRNEPINRIIRVLRTNVQGEIIPMNHGQPQPPYTAPPMPTYGPSMPPFGPPQIFPEQQYNFYQNRFNQYGPPPSPIPRFLQTLQQQPITGVAGSSTGNFSNANTNRNTNYEQQQPIHHTIGPLPAHIGQSPRPLPLNPNATPYQPLNLRYQQQQQPAPQQQRAQDAVDWNFHYPPPATNAPNNNTDRNAVDEE